MSDERRREAVQRLGLDLCEHCRRPIEDHRHLCGPFPLHLDVYEAVNLHQMLMELRETEAQSGDWYGQVAIKLEQVLDRNVEWLQRYNEDVRPQHTPNKPYPNGSHTYEGGSRW